MGNGKPRWKKIFLRPPPLLPPTTTINPRNQTPLEFLCPISGSLMADPVIVSSGHTLERNCVLACNSLSLQPSLPDGSSLDFSTIIPNVALKSTILNWCLSSFVDPPVPIDFPSALCLVRNRFPPRTPDSPPHPSSTERIQLATLPNRSSSGSCCSTSSDLDTNCSNSASEGELLTKFRSSLVCEQEEAVASLRMLTRTQEYSRIQFCTPHVLSALRSLIISKHSSIQADAVAAVVNLSLENENKVKIVRAGMVPPLIELLGGRSGEAKDHAAGALFSLAVDDQNKTAIGVLGALPPLLNELRSESERTRQDSALALYHLSQVQSNRTKLVNLGSVPLLLDMVESGHMAGRILMVLRNLAGSREGRGAMMDEGAVECLVRMLRQEGFRWREKCVAALCGLSYGGLRFKGLAKEAGAEEVMMKMKEVGSERTKYKARKVLQVLRARDEDDGGEAVDWEQLLESRKTSPIR